MGRRVTTSPAAAFAFRDARRWLTQDGSGESGAARWARLKVARAALKDYPYLGTPHDALPGCRQFVVSGYRLVYRVRPDTGDSATAGDIRVIALWGPGIP